MDGWRGRRDRVLADGRFQDWAARFWLTRPIARRQARALFDLCAGFVHSQVLAACVQLDIFSMLAAGPLDSAMVASRLELRAPAWGALQEAAVALRLLERRSGGRVGLGPLGAALRGNPGVTAMIQHHAMFYDDLRDPVALLRADAGGTRLSAYWAYADAAAPGALPEERVADYTTLMAGSQPMISAQVLAGYDFGGHRCLLDVGGGDGTFLRAVAQRYPRLTLMAFDLPAVVARSCGAPGRSDKIVFHAGDFTTDPLPQGADIVSFVRVLHDHNDDVVLSLLGAAQRALANGGTVLIAEPMTDDAGAGAYFSLYMLAMGQGRPRSAGQLLQLLSAAGFARGRVLRTPMPMLARLIVASCKSSLT